MLTTQKIKLPSEKEGRKIISLEKKIVEQADGKVYI